MSEVMRNYKEYLDSYSWKAIKKMKLEENPECEVCGDNATSVHHLSYDRLGKEKEGDIVSICEMCHHECHYIDGYQIKNSENELIKRFIQISNGCNNYNEDDYNENIDNKGRFIEGFSKIEKYSEPYYLAKNNELISPGNNDNNKDSEGLYQVHGESIVYNFIDKKGKQLFKYDFTSTSDFISNEANIVLFGVDFIINNKGKLKAKNDDEWSYSWKEGNGYNPIGVKEIGLYLGDIGYCYNYINKEGKILNNKWWRTAFCPLIEQGYYNWYTIVQLNNGYNIVSNRTGILFSDYEYKKVNYISTNKIELINELGNKRVINKNGEDINGLFKYI